MGEQLIPVLVMFKGALAGNRWPLTDPSLTMGRSEDCEIVIPERQISRYHARVERDSNGYVFRDLGSKNGSSVNGVPVKIDPVYLQDGDKIVLAD
ncbi:MAG: FHA domain-containing protein, partial [Anaerolineae bacterium]|nr:FHA domain-containing protein [Anaerolineae bacterium]